MNFVKCAVGALMMSATLRITEGVWFPAMDRVDALWLSASAVVGLALGDSLYFASLMRIGARRALLTGSVVPAFTAVAAWYLLSQMQVIGAAVTLAGVTWVLSARDASDGPLQPGDLAVGLLLGVGAAICQVSTNLITKDSGGAMSALAVGVVRLGVGATALGLMLTLQRGWSALREALSHADTRVEIAAGTMLGTYIGVWLMNVALLRTEAGVAATLLSTSPIWILPVSAYMQQQPISARSWVGAAVAVAGIAALCLA
jgi:drug/metabolite transporter (DMT)-like permease